MAFFFNIAYSYAAFVPLLGCSRVMRPLVAGLRGGL